MILVDRSLKIITLSAAEKARRDAWRGATRGQIDVRFANVERRISAHRWILEYHGTRQILIRQMKHLEVWFPGVMGLEIAARENNRKQTTRTSAVV